MTLNVQNVHRCLTHVPVVVFHSVVSGFHR